MELFKLKKLIWQFDPLNNDHLQTTTTFFWSQGWLSYTGLTVIRTEHNWTDENLDRWMAMSVNKNASSNKFSLNSIFDCYKRKQFVGQFKKSNWRFLSKMSKTIFFLILLLGTLLFGKCYMELQELSAQVLMVYYYYIYYCFFEHECIYGNK